LILPLPLPGEHLQISISDLFSYIITLFNIMKSPEQRNNMKKVVTLIALGLLLAGCVSNGKMSVSREQLENHRFVLESVNGASVKAAQNPPELSFGEDMKIAGRMCNRFSGQGRLSDGELTVKNTAMTRMLCSDPQLNELDHILSAMLNEGAQVDLTANQLTLATAQQTLTWKLAE
jgi:heat shock protein HslJ